MKYAIEILKNQIDALESDIKSYEKMFSSEQEYNNCPDVIRFKSNLVDCQKAFKMLTKKMVLVIHEKDHQDNEQMVIGVADNTDNAQKIINEYYGKHTELSFTDIRDCNLEWQKEIEVLDHMNKPYKVTVWLEWFQINQV